MLVSMVVLALLVVAMTALVDGATKLLARQEGRTDACREARAALVVMARDLRNAVAGTNADFIRFNVQSGSAPSTDYGSNVFFLASLPLLRRTRIPGVTCARSAFFWRSIELRPAPIEP